MIYFLKQRLFLLFFGIMFLTVSSVYAETARIENMTIKNTRDNLLLYFQLEHSFTDRILKAVDSGVKISFSFPVRVYKKRRMWPDENLVDTTLRHTIKFDALKKEYLITRSWKPEKTITVKTLDEAKKVMNHVDGFNLILVEELVRGDLYSATVKAEQDKLSLPYYLKYILFFLSFWEFETDWAIIDFEY